LIIDLKEVLKINSGAEAIEFLAPDLPKANKRSCVETPIPFASGNRKKRL
jgi:hypothetical protein